MANSELKEIFEKLQSYFATESASKSERLKYDDESLSQISYLLSQVISEQPLVSECCHEERLVLLLAVCLELTSTAITENKQTDQLLRLIKNIFEHISTMNSVESRLISCLSNFTESLESQRVSIGSESLNDLLPYLCEILYKKNLLFSSRHQILKVLIGILANIPVESSRQLCERRWFKDLRSELLHQLIRIPDFEFQADVLSHKITVAQLYKKTTHKPLVGLNDTFSDFEFQVDVLHCFYTVTADVDQRDVICKEVLGKHKVELIRAMHTIGPESFLESCRVFLNLLNGTIRRDKRVWSFSCLGIHLGSTPFLRPQPEQSDWFIDFNLASQRISFCFRLISEDSNYLVNIERSIIDKVFVNRHTNAHQRLTIHLTEPIAVQGTTETNLSTLYMVFERDSELDIAFESVFPDLQLEEANQIIITPISLSQKRPSPRGSISQVSTSSQQIRNRAVKASSDALIMTNDDVRSVSTDSDIDKFRLEDRPTPRPMRSGTGQNEKPDSLPHGSQTSTSPRRYHVPDNGVGSSIHGFSNDVGSQSESQSQTSRRRTRAFSSEHDSIVLSTEESSPLRRVSTFSIDEEPENSRPIVSNNKQPAKTWPTRTSKMHSIAQVSTQGNAESFTSRPTGEPTAEESTSSRHDSVGFNPRESASDLRNAPRMTKKPTPPPTFSGKTPDAFVPEIEINTTTKLGAVTRQTLPSSSGPIVKQSVATQYHEPSVTAQTETPKRPTGEAQKILSPVRPAVGNLFACSPQPHSERTLSQLNLENSPLPFPPTPVETASQLKTPLDASRLESQESLVKAVSPVPRPQRQRKLLSIVTPPPFLASPQTDVSPNLDVSLDNPLLISPGEDGKLWKLLEKQTKSSPQKLQKPKKGNRKQNEKSQSGAISGRLRSSRRRTSAEKFEGPGSTPNRICEDKFDSNKKPMAKSNDLRGGFPELSSHFNSPAFKQTSRKTKTKKSDVNLEKKKRHRPSKSKRDFERVSIFSLHSGSTLNHREVSYGDFKRQNNINDSVVLSSSRNRRSTSPGISPTVSPLSTPEKKPRHRKPRKKSSAKKEIKRTPILSAEMIAARSRLRKRQKISYYEQNSTKSTETDTPPSTATADARAHESLKPLGSKRKLSCRVDSSDNREAKRRTRRPSPTSIVSSNKGSEASWVKSFRTTHELLPTMQPRRRTFERHLRPQDSISRGDKASIAINDISPNLSLQENSPIGQTKLTELEEENKKSVDRPTEEDLVDDAGDGDKTKDVLESVTAIDQSFCEFEKSQHVSLDLDGGKQEKVPLSSDDNDNNEDANHETVPETDLEDRQKEAPGANVRNDPFIGAGNSDSGQESGFGTSEPNSVVFTASLGQLSQSQAERDEDKFKAQIANCFGFVSDSDEAKSIPETYTPAEKLTDLSVERASEPNKRLTNPIEIPDDTTLIENEETTLFDSPPNAVNVAFKTAINLTHVSTQTAENQLSQNVDATVTLLAGSDQHLIETSLSDHKSLQESLDDCLTIPTAAALQKSIQLLSKYLTSQRQLTDALTKQKDSVLMNSLKKLTDLLASKL